MAIVNTVRASLHRNGARFMGGVSEWMAGRTRREIDDIRYHEEDVFSSRAEASVKRLEFNETLARSNGNWNSQLVIELGDYDPSQDEEGYILKVLVLKNEISRFREMAGIYEGWVAWESGRSLWNGAGPANKVRRELDRILRNLEHVESQHIKLEAEVREVNLEVVHEIELVGAEERGREEGISPDTHTSVPSVPLAKDQEDR